MSSYQSFGELRHGGTHDASASTPHSADRTHHETTPSTAASPWSLASTPRHDPVASPYASHYRPSSREGCVSPGVRSVPWASPLSQFTPSGIPQADYGTEESESIDPHPSKQSYIADASSQDVHVNKLIVRVMSAETRRDLAGKKYTTYVMRVHHPKNSNSNSNSSSETNKMSRSVIDQDDDYHRHMQQQEQEQQQSYPPQIEHRYSEFAKLHKLVESYNISIGIEFPSKHWAGRIGNWTPSIQFAPTQHSDLIQTRKVQLDFWLLHLVEKFNRDELPRGIVQALQDFLTITDRAPCDQENPIVHGEASSWNWNNPVCFTLGSSIRQATTIVERMCLGYDDAVGNKTDRAIPLDLLHHAKGLCFLTVVKAGLVVSGRIGTGLLVARLDDDRWSAPCAMRTMGMGYGMLAGGDIAHYLVVLTSTDAVQSLLQDAEVQLGAELGVAVGPLGRGATSHVSSPDEHSWSVHAAYSYSHSKGLFAGISLEGSVLMARPEINAKFYGRCITAEEVMDQPPPKAAEPLYNTLRLAMAQDIPTDAFRPVSRWS